MLKKIAVSVTTIWAMAMFALPAVSMATWKHHEVPIVQDVTLGLTGQARFQTTEAGYFECQVTTTIVLTAGTTTGAVQSFGPDPANGGTATNRCKGAGALAGCQIHSWTPTNLPWVAHTGETTTISHGELTHIWHQDRIVITTGATHLAAAGLFCPITSVTTTPGTIRTTVNQPKTMASVTLSGSLNAEVQTAGGMGHLGMVAVLSGLLQIEAPNTNTYSI